MLFSPFCFKWEDAINVCALRESTFYILVLFNEITFELVVSHGEVRLIFYERGLAVEQLYFCLICHSLLHGYKINICSYVFLKSKGRLIDYLVFFLLRRDLSLKRRRESIYNLGWA